MPNNLQTLENEIRSKLPHLMELSAGCEIELYNDRYELICIDKTFYEVKDLKKQRMFSFTDNLPIKTIGHPITLPNVLEWLKGLELFKSDLGYLEYITKRDELLDNWDLTKNLLINQNEYLINLLTELTPKR